MSGQGTPTGMPADARAELRQAMSGPGLTPDRLLRMPAVLALARVRAAVRGLPAADVPVTAWHVVADAARSLGGGFRPRLLRTALAIDYDGVAKDLTARRAELVRSHNEGARAEGGGNVVAESPRALYEIERQMIDALVTVLAAEGEPRPAGEGAPARKYEHVTMDATCRFVARHIDSVETVSLLRALVPGLDEVTQVYYCSRDGGRHGELVVRDGGRVTTDEAVGRPNFRQSTIELPKPLRAGELHRLRFDVTYPGRSESEPWFVINVGGPVDFVAVRIAFDPECLPRHVSRVHRVPTEARGGDRLASVALPPDRFGYVEAEFTEPDAPFNYGIAWEW